MYNAGGQLELTIDGFGQETDYEYEATSNRLRQMIEKGVVQAVGPLVNLTTQYQYDENNNIVLETNVRNVTVRHTYDALDRRETSQILAGPGGTTVGTTINGQQQVISHLTYDQAGNVRTQTDLHGNTISLDYDGLYHVVTTHLPTGIQTRAVYDLVGNVRHAFDPRGKETKYEYDDIYRLRMVTDAEHNQVEYGYDASGNVVRQINTSDGTITLKIEYDDGQTIADGLGRPTTMTQTVSLGNPSGAPQVPYVTSYDYNDALSNTTITNPRGNDITDLAGIGGLMEQRLDGLGRLHSQTVDVGAGRLNLITSYTYDANGNVQSVRDPEGGDDDVTYTYDGLGRVIQAVYVAADPSSPAATEKFIYDGNGNLTQTTDRRGIVFSTTYDNLDRVLTANVREDLTNGGQWLTLGTSTYDDPANTVMARDANGNPTTTRFDALGRSILVTDALGQTVEMAYEDGVNLTKVTDEKKHVTHYQHDDINRVTLAEESDSPGGPTRTTLQTIYNDAQNQLIQIDRRGTETIEQYDSLGRLITVTRRHADLAQPYGSAEVVLEHHKYDGNGNQVLFIDAEGNQTKSVYDGADRVTDVIAAYGSAVAGVTHITYDRVGNVRTVKDPRPHAPAPGEPVAFDVSYQYDARYRLISATNGEGKTTRYTYDQNDNLESVTDPKGPGYATSYRYDELNTLTAVDETARGGGVTRYVYDVNRNKIAQQDALGNLVGYEYDKLNRLTDKYQYFVAGKINATTGRGDDLGGDKLTALHSHYGYDANGNPNLVIDPMGQHVETTYDYLDRLETATYSGHADPSLSYQPLSVTMGYDDNGNPTSVSEVKRVGGASVTETYAYAYDRLERTTSATNYDGKTITYTYDKVGNRKSVQDPDGFVTNYDYDARNRLTIAHTEAGDTLYDYWENSLLKSIVYSSGTIGDYSFADSYDRANRLTRLVNHTGALGNVQPIDVVISSYEYAYDDNGNRTDQIESHALINNGLPEATSYAYDRQDRLTQVNYAATGLMSYSYDMVGNRLTEVGQDPSIGTPVDRTYHYDRLNRLRSIDNNVNPTGDVAFVYDANGNRISTITGEITTILDKNQNPVVTVVSATAAASYYYNLSNQLVRTSDDAGAAVTFDYDASGMRVKKTTSAGETRYLYDEGATLLEYDGTGQTTAKYNYGYQLLSRTEVDATAADPRFNQFYVYDALGSTSDLTTEAGAIQVAYQYDAWGNERNPVGGSDNPKQFTGYELDPETGLYYANARYYDSTTGTFITQDSYLGTQNTPPSLHRYLYGYANPLRYIDPTGHDSVAPQDFQPTGFDNVYTDKNLSTTVSVSPNGDTRVESLGEDYKENKNILFFPQGVEINIRDPAKLMFVKENPQKPDGGYSNVGTPIALPDNPDVERLQQLDPAALQQLAKEVDFSSPLWMYDSKVNEAFAKEANKYYFANDCVSSDKYCAANAWEFSSTARVMGSDGQIRNIENAALADRVARVAEGNEVGRSSLGTAFYLGVLAITDDPNEALKWGGLGAAIAPVAVAGAAKLAKNRNSSGGSGGSGSGGNGGGGKGRVLVNIYGEGEAPRFMDAATNAEYAEGSLIGQRTLTQTLRSGTATEILLRNSPADATTIAEIQRLVSPGGRVTIVGPQGKGFQGEKVLAAFGERGTVVSDRTFTSEFTGPDGFGLPSKGQSMRMLQFRVPATGPGIAKQLGTIIGVGAGELRLDLGSPTETIRETALNLWSGLLNASRPIQFTVRLQPLPTGELGEARIDAVGLEGLPTAGTIILSPNAAGLGWFVDDTPLDHSEFGTTLDGIAFEATGDSAAAGKYDLLTVLLHETGHLLGFNSEVPGFAAHVGTIVGSQVFVVPELTAVLSGDGDHLDSQTYPNDLMNATLSPSVRRLPSPLDLQILNIVRGGPTTPDAAEFLSQAASLASSERLSPVGAVFALFGTDGSTRIQNGDFAVTDINAQSFAWDTSGSVSATSGEATLSEDPNILSGLSQTFTIPAGATGLQFTITAANFVPNSQGPLDAFEVALLDASTFASLVGTATGLGRTSSLLNIQQTGEVFFGPQVTVPGVTTSGQTAQDFLFTVTVDLSGVAAGTEATLFFDLLGFGTQWQFDIVG